MYEKVRIGINKDNSIKLELYLLDLLAGLYGLDNYENNKKELNRKIRVQYYDLKEKHKDLKQSSIPELFRNLIVINSIMSLKTEKEELIKLLNNRG